MSRRDMCAIGAGIAVLAGGVAGCSLGHDAEPDSSVPPDIVATQAATPAPDTSAAPTAAPAATAETTPPAEATEVKDGQTSDGRAYASLKPGDTVATTDYVGALRAGVKMFRFTDGSAAVIDPSESIPDAVVAEVSSGIGDGLSWRESESGAVAGHLLASGFSAFLVSQTWTEMTPDGWQIVPINVPGVEADMNGTTARLTVEEAIAARQEDIDAHPDVVIIGPNGIIPRG